MKLTLGNKVLFAIILLLFVITFFPTINILVDQWMNSDDYAHAFITIPVIGYMIWQKRLKVIDKVGEGSLVGLMIAIISLIVYVIALHSQIKSISSISMITTILGLLAYMYGFTVVKVLSTPFLLLLLLIPIPSSIYSATTLPLQLNVSRASEIVARLFNIPIFREGNIMVIPNKTFEIVQACSGMRSLITMVTMSLIIGYFTFRTNWSKFILVLMSIPVAILVNVLRVVVLIIVFYFYNVDLTHGKSHTLLGLGVFAIAIIFLFSMQRIIEKWETRIRKS